METDYEVGIVGAGFAGLSAALRLKKSRQDSFVMFERAAEVGGTWRDNIYPGCTCDVASPLYSFSGEPNPGWTQLYAGQPEIWAYLKHVVDKNDLRKHIRFGSDIVEAEFVEHGGCWQVTDRQGDQTTVRVLLLGMGPLNRPFQPQLPGLDAYKGAAFHSSAWDAACDLTGKRVGVIGTGASAIQIVPAVAPEAGHLTVFQRTPAWVSHRFDAPVGEISRQLYSRFPLLLRLRREFIYWLSELLGFGFTGNRTINRLMEWISRRKLAKEVLDPEVRQKLTPAYQIGCKRILRSDDYYPTFNRPNVSLVTGTISRFLPHGIMTADGAEHPLDVVVFATGFVAADINVYLRVTGLQGRNLIEEWKSAGAEAYLGTTVSGFPNLAFILGPNTGLGHNSVVHMMESQVHYLMQYLDFLRNSGRGSYLDVKPDVQQAYNQKIQKQFAGTVWVSGCKSWYTNAAGKNTTLFPRLTVAFRRLTRKFDPTAYHLIGQGEKAVVTDPVAV